MAELKTVEDANKFHNEDSNNPFYPGLDLLKDVGETVTGLIKDTAMMPVRGAETVLKGAGKAINFINETVPTQPGGSVMFPQQITEEMGTESFADLRAKGVDLARQKFGEPGGIIAEVVLPDFIDLLTLPAAGGTYNAKIGKLRKVLAQFGDEADNILNGIVRALQPEMAVAGITGATSKNIDKIIGDISATPLKMTAGEANLGRRGLNQGIEGVSGKYISTTDLTLAENKLLQGQDFIVNNYKRQLTNPDLTLSQKQAIQRKLNDAAISAPRAILGGYFDNLELIERGYLRVGDKLVYGGTKDLRKLNKVSKEGDKIIQHHLVLNAEGGSLAQKYAMQDRLFKVNMWRFLSKKGITPGYLKNNMALIANDPHLKELHPMLKSLGFDDYIRKLPNDLSGEDLFKAIETWSEDIYLPSLALTEDLIKSGHTKLISFNVENKSLILPKYVMNTIKTKNTTIADNLSEYLVDLNKRYEPKVSSFKSTSKGGRHFMNRNELTKWLQTTEY